MLLKHPPLLQIPSSSQPLHPVLLEKSVQLYTNLYNTFFLVRKHLTWRHSSTRMSKINESKSNSFPVQFSPLTNWVIGGTWEMIQHRSSSSLFCRTPLWAVLAIAGMFTLWCCPSSISSANHGVAHPPKCPKEWFWRGCHGVWHARPMQASISWQLPEEVPVDPHPAGLQCHKQCLCTCVKDEAEHTENLVDSHKGQHGIHNHKRLHWHLPILQHLHTNPKINPKSTCKWNFWCYIPELRPTHIHFLPPPLDCGIPFPKMQSV